MEFREIVSKVAQNYKDRSKIEIRNTKIWIEEVEKLYQKIKEWLNEYIEKGDIIVETGEPQIYDFDDDVEETYTMYLNFGDDLGPSIVFEPTGINIAETLGKINLYYLGHKEEIVYLLLIKENDKTFTWQMKCSNNYEKFSKELFEKQIGEWMIKWADI